MSQVSKDSVVEIFKKVYGKANDLRPGPDIVDELMPFEEGKLVGDAYIEDFITGDEVGITWAGTAQEAFAINPAIAGGVRQSTIQPSQTVLSSVLSWAFMSRSAGGDEQAFFDGTKHVMRNHLNSHNKLVTVSKLYGQSSEELGYVSYAPAGTVYRGATYSGSGTVTLTKKDGTTIAFTTGVCTVAASLPATAKGAILFAPGQFAAGHWVAKKGIRIHQIDANDAVVGAGNLVSWDARLGIIYVDFVPVVASGLTSHRLTYADWEDNKCMAGAHAILTNTGTLFGINAAAEPLWSGSVTKLGGKRFNLKAVHEGVADAINSGGLEEPLDIIVNPYTFGRMATDEAAFRKYDASYKAKAENGFEAIEYYAANGINRIHSSSKVKEGHAFGFVRGHWRCSGSQLPSFRVRGMNQEVIFPLQDQAGFVVRSFGDQYVMCRQPAKNLLWSEINFEAVEY
jgi:hypothetical protein